MHPVVCGDALGLTRQAYVACGWEGDGSARLHHRAGCHGGVRARPSYSVERPRDVVAMWVQERTGLLVREGREALSAEHVDDCC